MAPLIRSAAAAVRAPLRRPTLAVASHATATATLTSSSTTRAAPSPRSKQDPDADADARADAHSSSLLHTSKLSPSAPPPSQKAYSPVTVALVKGLAKIMGYNSTTSTAIRVTSDLYDRCSERAHAERHFWYTQCALPQTYQSWFQITNLHVYLLLVRFRALTPQPAAAYSQELVNHFFIDAESRMRERFGVQTSRLVKGYMRDMHMQQRGAILGLDEGLVASDARLAQAVWRNIWGAGWGTVAGVKRKLDGVDKYDKDEKLDDGTGKPELALDPAFYATATATADANVDADALAHANPEMAFPIHLHRIVTFIRRETLRLANISDSDIMMGHLHAPDAHPRSRSEEAAKGGASVATFTRI